MNLGTDSFGGVGWVDTEILHEKGLQKASTKRLSNGKTVGRKMKSATYDGIVKHGVMIPGENCKNNCMSVDN